MTDSRFSIPLTELEGDAHVAVTEQIQEQVQRRWHAPLDGLLLPFGDGMTTDADGD